MARKQTRSMTQEEWDRLLPAMQTFTHLSTEIGHSVLVKGESNKDVAERVGRTKQNVGSTVKRIWDLYQSLAVDIEGEKLRKVDVWIPEKLALKVLKEAEKYAINQNKAEQSE
ncbi:TPA: ArdK family transcriptional regulator [Klebsiella pneumoniae]|nr:ArdK family transcriptional regulator [Salmonella enterica]HCI4875214.1 ArdK family transcriptional regulator [Klebsiella pneumoniae]HCL6093376.1 ArdK family transcriptional regulator [Escherichia coli]HCL6862764.1 ArdK family transcriptional regulator [Klebsiella pneumoniae]HCM6139181.1 ArdK family transcriptional regulator [Klebsiella aerogenes]